jgi:uncharacterized membrane protein
MKKLMAGLLVASLAVFAGCESHSSTGGGPGSGIADKFEVKVPSLSTHVKQGEKKEVTLALWRGKEFKENVQLNFKVPQGLKVTPSPAEIKASETETKVMVEASDNAPLEDQTIEVTGVPDKGEPTPAVALKVTVEKK